MTWENIMWFGFWQVGNLILCRVFVDKKKMNDPNKNVRSKEVLNTLFAAGAVSLIITCLVYGLVHVMHHVMHLLP